MSVVVHEHGAGKRWEGRGYRCTACRNPWFYPLDEYLSGVTGALLDLADLAGSAPYARLRSISELPLIGEFPPPRFPIDKYGEIRPRHRYRRIR